MTASVPHSIAEPAPGGALPLAEIGFTIVTSEQPLTKTFAAGPDGSPQKAKDAGLSAGTVRRVVLRGSADEIARQFAGTLSGLAQNEALIMAPPPAGQDEWPLVRKDEVGGRTDAIARTKEYFQVEAGPALLMLDFDSKTYPDGLLKRLLAFPGKLSGILASVCPAIASAARVVRPSVSVGIRHAATGRVTPRTSGLHQYYFTADSSDCYRFAKRLADHLMLAGWIWGEIAKSGAILYRTLIDVTASSDPARLAYEADAVLADASLEHVPDARKPVVKPGGLLDTSALPELSPEEANRLVQIKADIAAKLRTESEAVRGAWLEERGKSLVARGVKPDVASRVLSKAAETHSLSGDFPIELDSGETVAVRDILANPTKYHRKTCADPLEPDYGGGKNKGIIYTNGLPHIHSLAHGGVEYSLRADAADFFTAVDGGAESEIWPEPVDVFGDGDPSALMDVPAGALPSIVDRYARDVAERMGAPVAFVALGAIVTASAAVGGKLQIQPKARDTGWKVPPFLWGVLVEDPGGKKSPVIGAVTAPLNRVDARWASADVPKRQAWEIANKKRKKDAPLAAPRPRLRRAVVDSFTSEGLRDVLVDNQKGVLVAADEITGLIGGLDQYKASGGSDRADMLKLMDGQSRTIDRVGRSLRVECWGAAVIGGIQPKKLAEMARSLDPDGLLQRFIPIVGDNVRRAGVDRAPDEVAVRGYESAIEGLAEIPDYAKLFEETVVTLSPGAQEIRQAFERRVGALLDMPHASDAWRGHLNKWDGFFARLLLVFHMLDNWQEHSRAAATVPVSRDTAERVWRFSAFLLSHAIRFYETIVGSGAAGEAARRAAGIILVLGQSPVKRRSIYEKHRAWRPDADTARELLDAMRALSRLGWCTTADTEGGVPSSWNINPLVFERFRDRTAAEAERRQREYARVLAAVAERRSVMSASDDRPAAGEVAPIAPCEAAGVFQ